MNITRQSDHLIQLTRFGMFNAFLVREDDGFTLIDTGFAGSAAGIIDAAARHGQPIRRILLTHAHADHVGSLAALHALLPDADIMISARDARFLKGDNSLDADEPQVPLRGTYQTVDVQPTRLLHAGDRIGSLEAIATPGHTPGHLAFFDTRDRALIAGDAFSTKAGISTGGTLRLLFPFPALATWHRPTGIRSAEALLALSPSLLAVGHGQTLHAPQAAMREAIETAKRRTGVVNHAA